MLFEDILFLLMLASGVFFIGIPSYKFFKTLVPQKRNPLADAKEKLEQAKLEMEAAKLNKEAEKLYQKMYEETLQDDDQTNSTKGMKSK